VSIFKIYPWIKKLNTVMNKYVATVRVNGQFVKSAVFADSLIHARLLFQYLYGMNSLLSAPTQINEIAPIKPLTPDQVRLKSMKDRVKRDQEAVKAERARQKIKAGQGELLQFVAR
jgi:hypothetical protein